MDHRANVADCTSDNQLQSWSRAAADAAHLYLRRCSQESRGHPGSRCITAGPGVDGQDDAKVRADQAMLGRHIKFHAFKRRTASEQLDVCIDTVAVPGRHAGNLD